MRVQTLAIAAIICPLVATCGAPQEPPDPENPMEIGSGVVGMAQGNQIVAIVLAVPDDAGNTDYIEHWFASSSAPDNDGLLDMDGLVPVLFDHVCNTDPSDSDCVPDNFIDEARYNFQTLSGNGVNNCAEAANLVLQWQTSGNETTIANVLRVDQDVAGVTQGQVQGKSWAHSGESVTLRAYENSATGDQVGYTFERREDWNGGTSIDFQFLAIGDSRNSNDYDFPYTPAYSCFRQTNGPNYATLSPWSAAKKGAGQWGVPLSYVEYWWTSGLAEQCSAQQDGNGLKVVCP